MRRGFTLLEVVLALLLFAVSTLATLELLRQAATSAGAAERRERILWTASGLLDSLSGAGLAAEGARAVPGVGSVVWRSVDGQGWMEVRLDGRDSAWLRLPVPAPPRETPIEGRW